MLNAGMYNGGVTRILDNLKKILFWSLQESFFIELQPRWAFAKLVYHTQVHWYHLFGSTSDPNRSIG